MGPTIASTASNEARRAAMFADTIATLHEAGIRDVVVVTPDHRVRERAQQLAAHVVDEPGDVAQAGKVRRRRHHDGIGSLQVIAYGGVPAMRHVHHDDAGGTARGIQRL